MKHTMHTISILLILASILFCYSIVPQQVNAGPKEIRAQLSADGMNQDEIEKYITYINKAVAILSKGTKENASKESYQDVIRNISLANDIYPFHSDAYHFMAIAYSRLGNYEESIDNFTKAIDYCKVNKDQLYIARGMRYLIIKKSKEALSDFDMAYSLNPTEENRKRKLEAEEMAKRIESDNEFNTVGLDKNSTEKYRSIMKSGLQAEREKKYHEAINYYIQATNIAPQDETAFFYMSRCYYELGNYEKIGEVLNKGLRTVKDKAQLYFLIGMSYDKAQNYNMALDCANKAIELSDNPTNEMYHLRSLSYLMLRNPEKALEDANTILSNDPNHEKALKLKQYAIKMMKD